MGPENSIRSQAGPATRVIELGGRMLLPGFIDAHVHLLTGGFQLAGVDLRDAESPEAFTRRIASHAATRPVGSWITGGGWDHQRWGGDDCWYPSATPKRHRCCSIWP